MMNMFIWMFIILAFQRVVTWLTGFSMLMFMFVYPLMIKHARNIACLKCTVEVYECFIHLQSAMFALN